MENFGGQYILTACRRVKDLIMTRGETHRLAKATGEELLGNDDDEIQQRNYLIKLFCPAFYNLCLGKAIHGKALQGVFRQ